MSLCYCIRKIFYILLGITFSSLIVYTLVELVDYSGDEIGLNILFTGIILIILLLIVIGVISRIVAIYKNIKGNLQADIAPGAKITSIDKETADYGRKNYKLIETTVVFSDGYQYITDETNYQKTGMGIGYTTYKMYTDDREIVRKAIASHERAVKRRESNAIKNKKPEPDDDRSEIIERLSEEYEDITKRISSVPVAKIKAMHDDGRMSDEQYRAIAKKYKALKDRKDEIEDELIRLGKFD